MSARLEYTEGVRLWPAWFHAAYLCRSLLCPAIRANGPSKNSTLPSPALSGVCPAFEPHTPPPSGSGVGVGSGVGSGVGTTTVAVGVGGTGVDVGVTGVAVGVTVGRGVTVGSTGVFVGVAVGGTGEAVGVGISVAVGVGLFVGVGGTGVEVGVGDGDGVIVGVGVGSPVNTRSKFLLVAPLTYSAVFLDFTPFRKNSITRPTRLESSGSTTRFRYAPLWMRAGRDS